ncbi:DNA oxidative demethylase AlkB [Wenzhouxiangella sediminis]|uniref:DNA oxidative demethylase AlkB n=2 Tax=Wenzhouxiangella sediminis TaxID=1792836 RepID=A0A3E1K7Z6_9GAMM|nr:DNA oxidative demethylase AlkB [Wenzhouxiangella sediminis]
MSFSGQLFDNAAPEGSAERFSEGAVLFHGRLNEYAEAIIEAIRDIDREAPFRHLVTPGGHRMSVSMTSCGDLGWMTDRKGYRYTETDPDSDRPWPPMPELFSELAGEAAEEAGFPGYRPDACLINRYRPGAKLSLHQDKDEQDYSHPVVSFSLGLPATFLWGGFRRKDKPDRLLLEHGDVLVWGGPDRLRYHGILPLPEGEHPLMGAQRINLTFRKAG